MKRMKYRKWWVLFPGAAHANSFSFEQPVTEREARAYVRWWLGHTGEEPDRSLPRLPRGTQVWPGRF